VVSAQSRSRAAADLEVTRTAFSDLLDGRVSTAIREAELVTRLPVFRAHLTDSRLATDGESLRVMADGYLRDLQAQFVIIARPDGSWLASPGWIRAHGDETEGVHALVRGATTGTTSGSIVEHAGQLYLVVSVPARFAAEILGTLTVGYVLNDDLARQLARVARCDVALATQGRITATSLGEPARAEAELLLSAATTRGLGVLPDLQRLNGRRYVAGTFALRPDGAGDGTGRLLLLADWQPTQAFIDRLRTRLSATGFVVLAVSLLGGVAFSRRLSRPMRDIATAATKIADGDLTLQLPVRGTTEAVTVAHAFNEMTTSLRTARDRLVHDAIHDHLTQLPNRALFSERVERALTRRARHPNYRFAVLFLDLDRFKRVNDSLGHAAGDQLIALFAKRLASVVRHDDVLMRAAGEPATSQPTLARFGGDEFAVLLDDISDPIDAVRVAERINRLSLQAHSIDGQDVYTSASIGVAVVSDVYRSVGDLLRDADLAMYRAKQTGGGGYAVFDAALHEAAVHRLTLETELRHALERGEFRVWYQPIVSLADGKVVGVEALVRWQHPERGLLAPGEFLQVAEDTGLVAKIDSWVLVEACRQASTWLRSCPSDHPPTVSVNVSAKAFAEENLVQKVSEALASTGCPPCALRLEITESVAITDAVRARAVLMELRALGVRVSLDDFGTGYCSLSYLQQLPVDTLKIDRSFTTGIGVDEGKGDIVRLIVGLGQSLGLDIVAEGAETETQVEFLNELGCGYGQGYYFSRPVRPDEVAFD
jgi:diguanylate cyclase (GGDEF)-like protein